MGKKAKMFLQRQYKAALLTGFVLAASAVQAAPDLTGVTIDTAPADTAGGMVIGCVIAVAVIGILVKVFRKAGT